MFINKLLSLFSENNHYNLSYKIERKMNTEITNKIKKLRIAKGYSHTDMADRLNITRSAYQRLESGKTYSWAKYLDEIMTTLETTPKEFFSDIGKKIIHQINQDQAIGYINENLYQENREITEQLIKAKDDLIAQLQKEIEYLKSKITT